MKFHFSFDIRQPEKIIRHTHRLLLMGSCFTENIGEKLRKHKFTVHENPNGILFNPVSVAEAMSTYIENRSFSADDIFGHHETWHSWQHHSRFSGITPGECLQKINGSITAAHQFVKNADHLMITLGSAWVYTLTDKAAGNRQGRVAANNHKAPADWFQRRLLSTEETVEVLDTMLRQLQTYNPGLQVIFTISPVRHLREGVIDNNRSKAVLIQAVHHLAEKYPHLYYFPAYELVIDDLRDYRFYAEDLVHPNHQATQYVWEKFVAACLSGDTQLLMKEIAEINLAYQHKPFNPSTERHRHFLDTYHAKTKALLSKHGYIDFSEELAHFASATQS
ncbi:MAG: hypothetical protein JWQ78_1235 [Sediminibacterium sp.]|nr:hypothetical protein [Sediminibacterium sp.]